MKTMNGDLAVSILLAAQKTKQAVYLKRGFIQVDAKSILGVMSLVDIDNIDVVTNAVSYTHLTLPTTPYV